MKFNTAYKIYRIRCLQAIRHFRLITTIIIRKMTKILITNSLVEHLGNQNSSLPQSHTWTIVASSAEEMIEIHRNENVDVIIMELDTPEMGGDTFTHTVRSDSSMKEVSIILITPDNESAIDRCFSSGANYIITEPINREKLVSKINEMLNIPDRERLRILMNITVKGKSHEHFYCTSQNISKTGILLETNRILIKGDILNFSFLLRLRRITANGEVVRVKQKKPNLYQYGIKFLDLDSESKTLIDSFVNTRRGAANPPTGN